MTCMISDQYGNVFDRWIAMYITKGFCFSAIVNEYDLDRTEFSQKCLAVSD